MSEAAYMDDLQALFDGHIATMGEFIKKVGQATDILRAGTAQLAKNLTETGDLISAVAHTFRGIRPPTLSKAA